MAEPSVKNGHCRKTEICFRFSAACRKPNEIDHGTVRGGVIRNRNNIQKHKCKLERSPGISVFWKCRVGSYVINVFQNIRKFSFIRERSRIFPLNRKLNSLHEHGTIGKLEGIPRPAIFPENSDTVPHAFARFPASLQIFLGGFHKTWIQ